tara:strand:- start:4708 stop:4989 length:282 start_codon:yes stop_codon:yes gene_type:complete
MSELKRWMFCSMTYPQGEAGMRIHPDGQYVKYQEYEVLTAELARTKEMLAVAETGLLEIRNPIHFGCYTERYRKARFMAKQALCKLNKMKETK